MRTQVIVRHDGRTYFGKIEETSQEEAETMKKFFSKASQITELVVYTASGYMVFPANVIRNSIIEVRELGDVDNDDSDTSGS